MIAETVTHFLAENVFSRMEEIDAKKEGLMRELLVEAGKLGLLGADIPEQYDDTETDEICTTIIAENVGATGSFAIAHGGHTGIGNLPIVYFGNEAQKAAYLPSIVSADKISAYALTEPGSGLVRCARRRRDQVPDRTPCRHHPRQYSVLIANTIFSTAVRHSSPMLVWQTYLLFMLKLMEINSVLL